MVIEIGANQVITAINPANKQVLGEVKVSSPDEITMIVGNARKAFNSWRKVPLEKRLGFVEQFRQVVYERREEISTMVTKEAGKPRVEALVSEVFPVLETCTWLQQNAARILAPEKVNLNTMFLPGKRSYNVFEPLGVIAVISPFNYPFSIPVTSILASLVAGNGVVLKPSPKTALVAQGIIDLFRQAGFPADLIGLVQGDRAEAEQLIHSDVNRIVFTGSVNGGKAIMALASQNLVPVTLELGGKHAAIVLKDSQPEQVAKALTWAAFTNAGQACASIERMYVEQPLFESMSKHLAELASKLRLGDGMSSDTDVGPVLDESQMLRIQAQVDDAVQQGARILAGGRARPELGGYFFEPTVLADVRPSMRVLKEEIFGPILPIASVVNAQEAIDATNASNLGLGASIWTNDIPRAEQIAREIEAGVVWVNDGLYTHICPDAPWGGVKQSGFGRTHSASELRDLVYVKNIGVNAPQSQDWNYPYDEVGLNRVRGGLSITHSSGILGKLAGLKAVIEAMLSKRKE